MVWGEPCHVHTLWRPMGHIISHMGHRNNHQGPKGVPRKSLTQGEAGAPHAQPETRAHAGVRQHSPPLPPRPCSPHHVHPKEETRKELGVGPRGPQSPHHRRPAHTRTHTRHATAAVYLPGHQLGPFWAQTPRPSPLGPEARHLGSLPGLPEPVLTVGKVGAVSGALDRPPEGTLRALITPWAGRTQAQWKAYGSGPGAKVRWAGPAGRAVGDGLRRDQRLGGWWAACQPGCGWGGGARRGDRAVRGGGLTQESEVVMFMSHPTGAHDTRAHAALSLVTQCAFVRAHPARARPAVPSTPGTPLRRRSHGAWAHGALWRSCHAPAPGPAAARPPAAAGSAPLGTGGWEAGGF